MERDSGFLWIRWQFLPARGFVIQSLRAQGAVPTPNALESDGAFRVPHRHAILTANGVSTPQQMRVQFLTATQLNLIVRRAWTVSPARRPPSPPPPPPPLPAAAANDAGEGAGAAGCCDLAAAAAVLSAAAKDQANTATQTTRAYWRFPGNPRKPYEVPGGPRSS